MNLDEKYARGIHAAGNDISFVEADLASRRPTLKWVRHYDINTDMVMAIPLLSDREGAMRIALGMMSEMTENEAQVLNINSNHACDRLLLQRWEYIARDLLGRK